MSKYIFLFSILFLPFTLFAQIQIGDIEVETLEELFNKDNTALYNDFGAFNKTDSRIWITNLPSMMIDSKDRKLIILAIKKELDKDSIRTVLIEQLNDQFGEFEEREGHPMIDLSFLEWSKQEDGCEYTFSISKTNEVKALYIIKN